MDQIKKVLQKISVNLKKISVKLQKYERISAGSNIFCVLGYQDTPLFPGLALTWILATAVLKSSGVVVVGSFPIVIPLQDI